MIIIFRAGRKVTRIPQSYIPIVLCISAVNWRNKVVIY